MDRLPTELQRLFLPRSPGGDRVRGPVLELLRPLGWETIGRVWEGVQVDLGLPAPAIAVSGTDACQLWFSLAEDATVSEAQAFLEGVRTRYAEAYERFRQDFLDLEDGHAAARFVDQVMVPRGDAPPADGR